MADVRTFRHNDANVQEYDEVLKFWSNGIGELCCPHGTVPYDITEAELPAELQRVYQDLYWEPSAGASLRYMVETKNGYGIALINEYDRVTAESSGVDFGPLFETVIADGDCVAKDGVFEKCEIFAGERMGFDGCHELVVVIPWDTPVEAFKRVAERLDELVYVACGINNQMNKEQGTMNNCGIAVGDDLNGAHGRGVTSLQDKLVDAQEKSVRFVTESVLSVPGLGAQAQLRDKVLDACYAIPGYEKLPQAERKQLYDLVKRSVELSMEAEREMPF